MAGQYIPNQIGRGSVPYGTGSSSRMRMLGNVGFTNNPAEYEANKAMGKMGNVTPAPQRNNRAIGGLTPKGGGHNMGGAPSSIGIQPPRTGTSPFGVSTPTNSGLGGFGGMNIKTTIQPKPLYTPQMTQWGVNQLKADSAQKANLPWLMKQYDTPGVSRSEGTMGLVAPQAGNIMAGGDDAAANLMLGDDIANQKQMLAGRIARSNEGYSLGNLYAALQESQDRFNQGQFGNTMGLMRYLG